MKCAVSRGAAAFELVTASQELNSYMSGAMARLCFYCSYIYIHVLFIYTSTVI